MEYFCLIVRTTEAIEDIPLGLVSSGDNESLNESLVATVAKGELLRNVCEHVSRIYIVALSVASCLH